MIVIGMMGKDVLTVGAGVLTGMITGTDLTTTMMTEVEVAIGTVIDPDLTTMAVKTGAGIRIGTIISPGITATATNNTLLIRMTATIKITIILQHYHQVYHHYLQNISVILPS